MTLSRSTRIVLLAGTLLGFLLGSGGPAAQTTSASLAGRVRTEQGRPLSGAVVQARSNETGAVRTAVTGADGRYRIDLLTPGAWTVAARLAEGGLSESRTVVLRLQQTVQLDFTVGTGLAEQVTVTAEPPLVDRKETAGKLRVTSEQADTLPLSGRVFTDLAVLDSSVRQAAPGNFYGERGSVFVVNGQTGRSNAFLVDGLDNNDDTSGTSLNSFFSQQVIREFVLSTHQYSAEFGHASGGVLNIVTHQGGNERTWEAFLQGTANEWNSPGDFVENLPDGGVSQDAARRLQTGFRLGGPFRKDRAFYFMAYEHQESNDVIPYTGIDRELVEGGRVKAPSEDDNLFLRTDFNLGLNHTLMLRLSADDRTSNGVNVGGIITPEAGFRIDEQDVQLAATLTSLISPRLISESRFLASTSSFDQFANSDRPGVTRPSGVFGGNNLNRQLRDEDKLQLVQNFTLRRGEHTMKFGLDVTHSRTDIFARFNPNGNLIYNSDRPFEPGECGLGVQVLDLIKINENDPDPIQEDGTVVDRDGNPLCIGDPLVNDDNDAEFNEGTNIFTYPLVLTLIDGEPEAQLDDTRLGLFAQDTWQVGSRLLLDYGLRYDLSSYTLPRDATVDSVIPNGGAGRDADNVAPRFGFTFTPKRDGKLLLRGGAGIFYDKLVLGFPAVAAVTSGTSIGLNFPQGFALEITEDTIEQQGIDSIDIGFPDEFVLRFSTATELETPYTAQFNLGIERAVGRHGAFRANVVRARGYHVPLMKDLNPVVDQVPLAVECDPDNLILDDDGVVPCHLDPSVGSIAAITTEGRSWYTGLDVGWRWQSANSWFSSSYTLSRAEDLGFDPLKGGISLPPDSRDLSGERGRSDGDRRHRVVLSGDAPLPWLGLRLSGVLQVASGLPFNVTTGQDDNLDGMLNDRPQGVRRNAGDDAPLGVVNELRVEHNKTLPVDRQLAPVTSLNEPGFAQIDLRLYRSFAYNGGRGKGQLFFQIINLLDRQNGGLIEGRAISRNFGEVITLAGPPRVIEVGLKFGG